MTTATTTGEPVRRSHYKGPRRAVLSRLPADVAERLERDAQAAGRSLSEHVAVLLDSALPQKDAAA